MEKLELDLEQLVVESFSASPEGGDPRGTVHGNDDDSGPTQQPYYISCMGYCGPSVEEVCQTTCNPILDCMCTADCKVTEMSCGEIG